MKIQIPRWVQMVGLPLLILLIWFAASLITTAIFLFISAAVISLMLNPLVKQLERIKIPRYIGVFVVYLALLAIIVVTFILVLPPTITQLQELVDNFPAYADAIREQIESWKSGLKDLRLPFDVGEQVDKLGDRIRNAVVDLGPVLLSYSIDFVNAIGHFFIVLVISIYMLLDAKRIGRFVRRLFPDDHQGDADEFIRRSQDAVTHWVRGQALMCLLIGISSGLGIWLLGVVGIWPEGSQYAIFFGAWAGVTEFIPYIGPILGALPPIIIALFASPWSALAVMILFIAIQQVEGHILVPNIMGTMVGVHPLVVIFAVLAGAELRGIVGMIVALPLLALGREVAAFFKDRVTFEAWKPGHRPPLIEESKPEEG